MEKFEALHNFAEAKSGYQMNYHSNKKDNVTKGAPCAINEVALEPCLILMNFFYYYLECVLIYSKKIYTIIKQ